MNFGLSRATRTALTRDLFTEDLKCINETPRKLPRETMETQALVSPFTLSCKSTALALLCMFVKLTGDVTMSQIQSAGSLTAVSPEAAGRTTSKRQQVPRGQ